MVATPGRRTARARVAEGALARGATRAEVAAGGRRGGPQGGGGSRCVGVGEDEACVVHVCDARPYTRAHKCYSQI